VPVIGLGQFNASSDREHNLAQVESLIQQARDAGVSLVGFHELATTTYFCFKNDPRVRELAEHESGISVTRVRRAAAEAGVAVVFPFYERGDDGYLYNAAVVIDGAGEIVGKYRKVSVPVISRTVEASETVGDEQFYFSPGNLGLPVFEVAGLKVGIMICYDRHFVEAARVLGLAGAELVFVPTATYRTWFRRAWEAELIGHAIANKYYVAGINRVGVEQGGAPDRTYFGSSLLIDYNGSIVTQAGDREGCLLTGEVSPEAVADSRDLWGFFRYRRPELYGPLVEPAPGAIGPPVPAPEHAVAG
jgi:beta-ureidopropionase